MIRPYMYALGVAAVLVVGGLWIVTHRSTVATSTDTSTWTSGRPQLINTASTYAQSASSNIQTNPSQSQGTNVNIPEIIAASSSMTPIFTSDDSFDYNNFIAMLSHPSVSSVDTRSTSNTQAANAYAMVPEGLISTTTPQTHRTAEQQALYDYGNEIGTIIMTYEHNHGNQAAVLTDSLQDRYNPDKIKAVEDVAHDLSSVGDQLLEVTDVPPEMSTLHDALAKSYQTMGQKLLIVPHSPKDDDLLAAINVYNASADVFITKFVAMANAFKAYNVTFSPDDQGSVFTFSPVGGL